MSDEGYEMQYIREAFESNWIAPMGKNVDEFEREFISFVGSRAGVALSTGTAALHMALLAAGVEEGDIVFCQALTFAASANPIIYRHAIPVFIDSDEATWNMDPERLEDAFLKYRKQGKKPKAVIVAHLYGLSADLDRIVALCKEHDTVLIEDAAESLGTLYKGRYTGTFGDFGAFSFNGNKIITTSGGGMLVSDNEERIRKVRFWATQAREPVRHYEHRELGFNYRMSNILAGIGRGQLKVLDRRIAKKRYIFDFYKSGFSDIPDITMMPIMKESRSNCWLSCIRVIGRVKPMDIILALEKENIEARPIWMPMQLQPFYRGYDFIGKGVSEKIYESGVCLPSDTKMSDGEMNRVVSVVRALWN